MLDADLQADDPIYPNLIKDGDHYSNAGFIKKVSHNFSNHGSLELQHFYVGDHKTQVWRIPVGSIYDVKNAKLTFTLPKTLNPADVIVTADPNSVNHTIKGWYDWTKEYDWAPIDAAKFIDNQDGTWTVDLGDLNAYQATVLQFNIAKKDGTAFNQFDPFVASAHLIGQYTTGDDGGCAPLNLELDEPLEFKGQAPECSAVFLSHAKWPIFDRTLDHGFIGTLDSGAFGKAWIEGTGPENLSWQAGAARSLSLNFTTTAELQDATFTLTAKQGMTLEANATAFNSPGLSQAEGFESATTEPKLELTNEGKTLIVSIDSLPANSSFSLVLPATVTGDFDVAEFDLMAQAKVANCVKPDPVVEYGPWEVDEDASTTSSLVETRTITTTNWTWDHQQLKFIEDPVSEREERTTELSKENPKSEPSQPTKSPSKVDSDSPKKLDRTEQVSDSKSPRKITRTQTPRTGAEIATASIAAIVILIAGASVLALRKRK